MEYTTGTDEMKAICAKLIEQHHPHLSRAKIGILIRDKTPKSKGKSVIADASLPTPKLLPLLDDSYQFVICVSEDAWDKLSPAQREAVMDHELCHCGWSEAGEPRTIGHDLEEFVAVVKRHGLWRGTFLEAEMRQAFLFEEEEMNGRAAGERVEAEG